MEKSRRKKFIECFVLFIAGVEMLFFSGITHGFNSLIPTLEHQNYFKKYCDKDIPRNNTCPFQMKMYSYVMVTYFLTINFSAFILGVSFDKFGHSYSKLLSAGTFFLGCLCFALSSITPNELLFPGVVMLAIASQLLVFCNYYLPTYFLNYQNILISLYSGLFDISLFVFGIIGVAYKYGMSILLSFIILAILGLIILPINAIKYFRLSHRLIDISNENLESVQSDETINWELESVLSKNLMKESNEQQIYIESKYPNLKSIIISKYFISHVLFTVVVCFRNSFFLSQLNQQLKINFTGQVEKINNLLLISSFVFGFGILSAPISGWIVDALKNRINNLESNKSIYKANLKCFVIPFWICSLANLLMSILIMIPQTWAVYTSYIMFTIARAFLYGLSAGYLLKAFPIKYYGRLSGILMTLWGVFSILQYPLSFNDPLSNEILNYVLIGLSSLAFIHSIILLK